MKTIQEVTKDFFNTLLFVIAKNSSKSYGLVALRNIKKSLNNEFPFVELIKISDSTIKIDRMMNSIDSKKIKRLFTKTINILGPNFLKLIMRDKLDEEDIKYLNKIGVKF